MRRRYGVKVARERAEDAEEGGSRTRRRRGKKVAIYEAGSCQERVGVDWFTHLFEIPRGRGLHSVNTWSQSTVRRGLIQEHEFFSSGYLRAQRQFNRAKPFSTHSRLNQHSGRSARFPPGPHFRDYGCGASLGLSKP